MSVVDSAIWDDLDGIFLCKRLVEGLQTKNTQNAKIIDDVEIGPPLGPTCNRSGNSLQYQIALLTDNNCTIVKQ